MDTRVGFAIPNPGWQGPSGLTPPTDDAAYSTLAAVEPTWADELATLDGWPMRPTIIIPLDHTATAVDATQLAIYAGTPLADTGRAVDARLDPARMQSLIVEPHDPFPFDATDVVLVVRRGAVTGAHAIPACTHGTTNVADPAYAATAALLPAGTDPELALPIHLASTWRWLPALRTRVAAHPVLVVTSSAPATLASFGAAAPDAATAAALHDPALSGVLSLPWYEDGSSAITLDPDGAPHPQGLTAPAFVVALPESGSAPYPFVLYQHGGGQSPTDIFALAQHLATAGFAFVAIDLPEHGNRAPAGGGSDMSFLDFADVRHTRSNFQQTVADHIAVLEGTAALNTAIEAQLGVAGALDPSRAFVMGMSIGGISTSITFAVEPRARATASFVGGGGYPEIVVGGLFGAFLSSIVHRPEPDRSTLLALGEALLDGADPLAYAQRAEDRTAPLRPALFVYAIGDPIVPSVASDTWGRAFGASLALPKDHAVPGMMELALPAMGTRFLVQAPANDLSGAAKHELLVRQDWAQQLVAHCFSTLLTTGECETIDTGWAMH